MPSALALSARLSLIPEPGNTTTPIGSTGEELTARMHDEVKRWTAVVKQANIKFE